MVTTILRVAVFFNPSSLGTERDDNDKSKQHGKEEPTEGINLQRQTVPAVTHQGRRHNNLDKGEKNQESAAEDKLVEFGHVRDFGDQKVDRKAISDQGQHRSRGNTYLGPCFLGVDPEDGPGHHNDQHQWHDDFVDVVF